MRNSITVIAAAAVAAFFAAGEALRSQIVSGAGALIIYSMTNTVGYTPTTVFGASGGADAGKCLIASNNGLPGIAYSTNTFPCSGLSGSAPAATGTCPIQTQVGGNSGGSFVMNGACIAGTVILTFSYTAPNGWFCDAHDQTTPTDAIRLVSSTVTTATLSGTAVASDVVSFLCSPY